MTKKYRVKLDFWYGGARYLADQILLLTDEHEFIKRGYVELVKEVAEQKIETKNRQINGAKKG